MLASVAVAASHGASSSSVVVSATVPSATSIVSACSAAGASLGTVLPGTSAVTSADCLLTFGSSNDSSRLLVHQSDGTTAAFAGSPTGTLDPAFAGGTATFSTSVVTTSVTTGGSAVQDDGKLLITTPLGQAAGTPFDVRRVRTDGTLDPAFGTGGVATIAMGASQTASMAVEQQPDGKIVVCGYSNTGAPSGNDFAFIRLLADGTLDPSFGTGGRVYVAGSTSTDICYDLVVLDDGRILAAGAFLDVANNNWDTGLVQLLPDGSLDPTFGTGGIARHGLGPAASSDYAYSIAVAGDGTIYGVGSVADGAWSGAGQTYSDVLVAGFRPDGSLLTSFNGGAGWRALTRSTTDIGAALSLQRDGRLLVTSRSMGATFDAVLWRLLATGGNDPAFNGGALRAFDSGGTEWGGQAIEDAAGRIVMGMSWTSGGVERMRLVRMASSGTDDPTFGTLGAQEVLVGDSGNKVRGVREVDGGLVAFGFGVSAGRTQPIVAKFAAARVPDYASGTADWATGADGAFGVCTRAVSGTSTSWTVDPAATCAVGAGTHWRGVPSSRRLPDALAATRTTPGTADVRLRFGLRASVSQPAGAYAAPITFSVVAPG